MLRIVEAEAGDDRFVPSQYPENAKNAAPRTAKIAKLKDCRLI